MDIAIQIIANDKTVRNDTVQDLKEFNSQSLATQAKKGEQLVSMMPAIKKAFNLMGEDIVELSFENDALKNKTGPYDEKWLEDSKARLLQQIDDEKKANLIMFRMKKKWINNNKWHTYHTTNFGKVNLMASFLKEINYKI